MKFEIFGIGLLACVLAGCGGKGPQRPSTWLGREPEPDSATLALLELNQQMAVTADAELLRMAQASDDRYALYDGGAWVCILDKGDTTSPAVMRDEECVVRLSTYTLGGQLLTDVEQPWRIGRYELPMAVDRNITNWNHHSRVRILAPWYSAYGLKGTDDIPPYENVIIEIEIQ